MFLLRKKWSLQGFQSGFRPYQSAETALIRVTNDLFSSSHHGCISLRCYSILVLHLTPSTTIFF